MHLMELMDHQLYAIFILIIVTENILRWTLYREKLIHNICIKFFTSFPKTNNNISIPYTKVVYYSYIFNIIVTRLS